MGIETEIIRLMSDLRKIGKYFKENGFEIIAGDLEQLRKSIQADANYLETRSSDLTPTLVYEPRTLIYSQIIKKPTGTEPQEEVNLHKGKQFFIEIRLTDKLKEGSKWYELRIRRSGYTEPHRQTNLVMDQYHPFFGPEIDMEKFENTIKL
jgi:hypothetical protein